METNESVYLILYTTGGICMYAGVLATSAEMARRQLLLERSKVPNMNILSSTEIPAHLHVCKKHCSDDSSIMFEGMSNIGDSCYTVAVANGFKGTLEDWIHAIIQGSGEIDYDMLFRDIDTKINNIQSNLSTSLQQLVTSELANAQQVLAQATTAYTNAKNAYDGTTNTLTAAQTALNDAVTKLNTAITAYNNAKSLYDQMSSSGNQGGSDCNCPTDLESTLTGLRSSLTSLNTEITSIKADIQALQNNSGGGSTGATVAVIDNLTSTSTTSALSANQGKVLKSQIDGKQATISDLSTIRTNASNAVTSIGTLSLLNTTAKGNLVAAINEVKAAVNNTSTEGNGGTATPVVDNLTSTSATAALSANQGKVLKDLIDNLSIDKAEIGKSVFKGDYMYSMYGTDENGDETFEYNSMNLEDPYAENSTFKPSWCVNLKTGEMWVSGGKIYFDGNGSGNIGNGKFKWDENGNIDVQLPFLSSSSAKKISDPTYGSPWFNSYDSAYYDDLAMSIDGGNHIWCTTDGLKTDFQADLTQCNLGSGAATAAHLACFKGYFYVFGLSEDTTAAIIYRSTDAKNWTKVFESSYSYQIYSNNYMLINTDDYIFAFVVDIFGSSHEYRSSDGITFEAVDSNFYEYAWKNIARTGNYIYTTKKSGSKAELCISKDGIEWNNSVVAGIFDSSSTPHLCANGDTLVYLTTTSSTWYYEYDNSEGVSNYIVMYRSTDCGKNWTNVYQKDVTLATSSGSTSAHPIHSIDGYFFTQYDERSSSGLVSSTVKLMSKNGITWSNANNFGYVERSIHTKSNGLVFKNGSEIAMLKLCYYSLSDYIFQTADVNVIESIKID